MMADRGGAHCNRDDGRPSTNAERRKQERAGNAMADTKVLSPGTRLMCLRRGMYTYIGPRGMLSSGDRRASWKPISSRGVSLALSPDLYLCIYLPSPRRAVGSLISRFSCTCGLHTRYVYTPAPRGTPKVGAQVDFTGKEPVCRFSAEAGAHRGSGGFIRTEAGDGWRAGCAGRDYSSRD